MMRQIFWSIFALCVALTVVVGGLSCLADEVWVPILVWLLLVAVWTLWVVVSLQEINSHQVALRDWAGELDESCVLGPGGLHFVPWFFWLIRLKKFSTDKFSLNYLKKEGTAFDVRTKEIRTDNDGKILPLDQQLKPLKTPTDAAVLWEPPWKHAPQLARLVRAGVPLDDPAELARWIFRVASSDVVDMIGKKPYTEVMGGKANNELTKKLRRIITSPKHVFRESGFFGKDPKDNGEGKGVFDFKIEFVHLPDNVSSAIDAAEAEKWRAEEAEYEARREATENIGAFIQMLVQSGYGTEETIRTKIAGDEKLKREILDFSMNLTLRDQTMKGGGKLFKLELPTGLGDLNTAIATGVALLKGLGDSSGPSSAASAVPPSSSGPSKTSGSGGSEKARLARERLERSKY